MAIAIAADAEIGSLPTDWPVVTIGSLNPFVTSGSRGWAAYYAEYGAPFIRITNLTRASINLDLDDVRYVRLPNETREGTRTQLRERDVLISITADIGIVACVGPSVPRPAYINQHIALMRFDPSVADGRFIAHCLASHRSQKVFRAMTDTGAKAGMNLTTIQDLKVPLPPLPEQRAIADALDDADGLVVALGVMIQKKYLVRDAVRHDLLTARVRLPGFAGEWAERHLGDFGAVIRGVSYDPDTDLAHDDQHDTFRLLRANNVQGGVLSSADVQFVRRSRVRPDQALRPDDVVVCAANGSRNLVGKAGRFDFDDGHPYTFGAFMACYRPASRDADPLFLAQMFQTSRYRHQVSLALAGSSINNLGPTQIGSFSILVPQSIAEQRGIARVLSDLDVELAALEAQISKAQDLKLAMSLELLSGRTRLA